MASTEAADVVAPIPLNKSITNTEKDVNEEIRTSRIEEIILIPRNISLKKALFALIFLLHWHLLP